MLKINLKIDKKIYSIKNIKKCLKIFKKDFDMDYKNWILSVNADEEDESIIYSEFMNYLIYLEVKNNIC